MDLQWMLKMAGVPSTPLTESAIAKNKLQNATPVVTEAADDDDDEGLTKAEKELAAMGTDLDDKAKKKLDRADRRAENASAKKVKASKEDEDEEVVEDEPKEEGVATMTQKFTLSERDRRIAGISDPMDGVDPNSDVVIIYEGEAIKCCFSKDQFAQARAFLNKAKSSAGKNGGGGLQAKGLKFMTKL